MTDAPEPDDLSSAGHDDLLAGEYVLGTLPGDERRAARDRAELDAAFAARIGAWEQHLSPLNDEYSEAPAPDLLPAIEARLFPAPAARPRHRWRLLGALAGVAVAGLMLVGFMLNTPPPGPQGPVLQAELVTEGADLVFAALVDTAGQVQITRATGPAAVAGQDYELWVIDDTGIPRSLGLLRDPVTTVEAPLVAGLTLAVSLEPEGGSPDAGPTGPVLASATLTVP